MFRHATPSSSSSSVCRASGERRIFLVIVMWRILSVQRNAFVRAFSASSQRSRSTVLPRVVDKAFTPHLWRQQHERQGQRSFTPCPPDRRQSPTTVQHLSFSRDAFSTSTQADGSSYEDLGHVDLPEMFGDRPTQHTSPSIDPDEYWSQQHGLNKAQCEAVTQPLACITRVVAGPGSGKTRVLTCRIAHLLQQTSWRERILAVTFTRKAAGEMKERLEKLLVAQQQGGNGKHDQDNEILQEGVDPITPAVPPAIYRVTLGTFHSVCAKILRWNGDLLSTLPSVAREMSHSGNETVLDGNFVIIDQSEQVRLVKECLTDANIQLAEYREIRPFNVISAISKAKSKYAIGEDPFILEQPKKKLPTILQITSKVYPYYVQKMLSTNCLDFDDLILLARELLMTHEQVRETLQRRWTHVLIDEFQDTSKTQMELVKLLTSSSLFVVGDADQSIYSWRGAHVTSLMDLKEEFKDYLGGVQTIYLMENYRSTSNIVKAAQKIISSSKGSKADELRQDMKPKRGSGPAPRVISCSDDNAEAEHIIGSIKDKVDAGEYSAGHEVALIYRTNAQSRVLEEACVKRNLPYVQFGSATSFYKRREIKDVLCFLRWLHNGMDRGSMLRAMTTPPRGLGDKAIEAFDGYCTLLGDYWARTNPRSPRLTPLDVLISFSDDSHLVWGPDAPVPNDTIPTRPLKLLTAFSHQMRILRDKAYEEPLEIVVAYLIDSFELLPYLDKISKTTAEFEERKANVRELQSATQKYANAGPSLPQRGEFDVQSSVDGVEIESPLGEYLDDVALVTDMADQARDSQDKRFKVCLMTIHGSKGMEFDTVYVVGNEEGTFPTSQALMEGEGSVVLEEERRLCYVAMTRAKTELFLTWRKEVPIFTTAGIRTVKKERSRFLDVLVAKQGTSGATEVTDAQPVKRGKKKAKQSTRGTNAVYSRASSLQHQESSPRNGARRTTSDFAAHHKDPGTHKNSFSSYDDPNSRYERRSSWKKDRLESPGTNRPKPAGTQTVYARRNPTSFLDTPSSHSSQSSVPPKRHPARSSPNKQNVPSSSPTNANMDSTWFFPVGSKVKHDRFGEGVVLPPPVPKMKGDMPVLVQFPDGERLEFSAHGTDISPILF